MGKRKISVEKNPGHSEPLARPSVLSLRDADANRQRQSRSAKPPSAQNSNNSASDKLAKSESNRHQTMPPDRGDEARPAKTKRKSRERSKEAHLISSPRLKSFPVERIKKLDNPSMFSPEPIGALIVQQNPRESGTLFVGARAENNNGQGDAMSTQLSPTHHKSQPSDAYQQQIATNDQRIVQTTPHSESSLTRRVASPERQAHRPSVPNVFQAAATHDRLPRHSTMINQPAQLFAAAPRIQQSSSDPYATINRNRDDEATARDAQLESRSIDRQMQQQKLAQAAIARDRASAPPEDRLNGRCNPDAWPDVHSQDAHCVRSHGDRAFHETPWQICRQSQYHQRSQQACDRTQLTLDQQQQQQHDRSMGMCCNYYQQSSAPSIPGQGMTSPQDMTMNQARSSTQCNPPVHRQNFGYHVNPPSAWPRNDRWMQTADYSRQHPYQQVPSRCRCQSCDKKNIDLYRQNFSNPDQSASSQHPANRTYADGRSGAEDRGRRMNDEKTLPFTPDMIRDQELLVSTMRQQCIPEDVMRRQFNALLNEQRRHLAYTAHLQQREDSGETKEMYRVARRRTDREEKPEWMVHITPPRMSYSEAVRMKAQRGVDESAEEIGAAVRAQLQDRRQQGMEERIERGAVAPQQMYFQMDARQPWQQQTTQSWPYRCDHQMSRCYAGCVPYANHQQNSSEHLYRQPCAAINGYNQQRSFYQYPYSMPCIGPSNAYQKACLQERDASTSQPIDDRGTPAAQDRRPTEPSSLLKIRVYKEMIRPQRRNNGLQDLESVRTQLEELKDPASRKGLEYLANLAKRKAAVRLNGTQDPNEIPESMEPRPPATANTSQTTKRTLANGLENGRNSDNPATRILQPKRINEIAMMEYPRQKRNPSTSHNMRTENSRTAVSQHAAVCQARNAQSCSTSNRGNAPIEYGNYVTMPQFAGYRQTPQYHFNERSLACRNGGQGDIAGTQRPNAPDATRIDRAGGDTAMGTTKCIVDGVRPNANAYGQPEIGQARTSVGSAAYLAGKPDYAIDNLVVSPDKLIASRHLQPPMIL